MLSGGHHHISKRFVPLPILVGAAAGVALILIGGGVACIILCGGIFSIGYSINNSSQTQWLRPGQWLSKLCIC